MFVLITNAIEVALFLIYAVAESAVYFVAAVMVAYVLAALVPSISLAVRRLHDAGYRGWWYLLVILPFGIAIVTFLLLQRSDAGNNRFGPPAP